MSETHKLPIPELAFSHMGFHVTDMDKMVNFYQRLLGFSITDRGRNGDGPEFCFFSRSLTEHHQFVLIAGRPPGGASNMNQLSFRVSTHDELKRLFHIVQNDPEVTEIYQLNHGNSWSIYVGDPEGNTIELFFQTPWYVSTPSAWELDFSLPEDELMRITHETAHTRPGFLSRDGFYKKLRDQLRAEGTAEVKVMADPGNGSGAGANKAERRDPAIPELAFSHLGFHVTDIATMVDFHQRLLGFSITDQGKNRDGLEFCFFSRSPDEHHQVVFIEGRPPGSETNLHHLAYRVSSYAELMRLYDVVQNDAEVTSLHTMNHGNSWSIYVGDPEGNSTELFFQTPWYVKTPSAWDLDIELPEDELLKTTEETARTWPGFMERDAFYGKHHDQLRSEGTIEVKVPVLEGAAHG